MTEDRINELESRVEDLESRVEDLERVNRKLVEGQPFDKLNGFEVGEWVRVPKEGSTVKAKILNIVPNSNMYGPKGYVADVWTDEHWHSRFAVRMADVEKLEGGN